ncbi:unnamed protein product [Moneuplotes crassus]|uniref:Uncharacterized protein n=1 Tax=Euplotes crassus TaxID=5936 RepID=A0AAD1UMN6_EUPCR|nr:unnamed protein product [Moneuplotes crassus]
MNQTDWDDFITLNPAISKRAEHVQDTIVELLRECQSLLSDGPNKKKKSLRKKHTKRGRKTVLKSIHLKTLPYKTSKDRDKYKKKFTPIENQALEQAIEFNSQVWSAVHKNMKSPNTTGEDEYFRSEDSLLINCADNTNQRLLKRLKGINLTILNEVELCNISEDNLKDAKSVLNNLIPMKVNELSLRAWGQIQISPYMTEIIRGSSRTQTRLTLERFRINHLQVVKIFAACKHLKAIKLCLCEVTLKKFPDFSKALQGTSIQTLSLVDITCVLLIFKPGRRYRTGLEAFLNCLSRSDLKNSLQSICFGQMFKDSSYVYSIVDSSGFGHVELYGRFRH